MNKKDLKMIAKSAEEACSMRRPVCLIFTSEITTEVKGSGLGGPCQEVALATAIQLKKRYDKYECLRVRCQDCLVVISQSSHYHGSRNRTIILVLISYRNVM